GKDAPANQGRLQLRVPAAVKALKAGNGYQLVEHDPKTQTAWVGPADKRSPPKGPLVLEYDFALPRRDAGPHAFEVPLVVREKATGLDTKVRFWGAPGTLPLLVEAPPAEVAWKDAGTEVVAGDDRLPLRVYQSDRLGPPLKV